MKNIFLAGKNLYLRSIRKSDLKGNYAQWFNDQKVCKSNSHGYFPSDAKKMEDYIERVNSGDSNLVLAIIFNKNKKHIGNISLQNINWVARSAEYAIIIGEKRFWGRSLAREASDLILRHGFLVLNLNRIYCGTPEDNIPMQKLALSLGMKKEGVRRQAFFKHGSYKDMFEYGVLRPEYLK